MIHIISSTHTKIVSATTRAAAPASRRSRAKLSIVLYHTQRWTKNIHLYLKKEKKTKMFAPATLSIVLDKRRLTTSTNVNVRSRNIVQRFVRILLTYYHPPPMRPRKFKIVRACVQQRIIIHAKLSISAFYSRT